MQVQTSPIVPTSSEPAANLYAGDEEAAPFMPHYESIDDFFERVRVSLPLWVVSTWLVSQELTTPQYQIRLLATRALRFNEAHTT